MKCKFCNCEMRLDDVDYNFSGNQDNYYTCDNCGASAFEKIRYHKSIYIDFIEGEKNEE